MKDQPILQSPFELLRCSWPRPALQSNGCWASEPDWESPEMPVRPDLRLELLGDEMCWMINWREFFRHGTNWWDPRMGGEMRGFYVVFQLGVQHDGMLVFWDDDGSLIRRAGQLVHRDPSAHALTRHLLPVRAGDRLEIAQWQLGWDWLWGARLDPYDGSQTLRPADLLGSYLPRIKQRLQHPDGPPLKMYTNGQVPLRAVVALYSLILNGYAPSQLYLFGDEQWSPRTHGLFHTLLPFAQVVGHDRVLQHLRNTVGPQLADLARKYWFVMKACLGLFFPPAETTMMDDDVFILEPLQDALDAFQASDLVFTPDQDLNAGYQSSWAHLWPSSARMPTARFNAGLYWIRPSDTRSLAAQAMRGRVNPDAPFLWEQGFIASAYAHKRTYELPSQRYFFPLFEGLPNGIAGYDYRNNPCGFASIHFGGLAEKPSDGLSLQLAGQLLDPDRRPPIGQDLAPLEQARR